MYYEEEGCSLQSATAEQRGTGRHSVLLESTPEEVKVACSVPNARADTSLILIVRNINEVVHAL